MAVPICWLAGTAADKVEGLELAVTIAKCDAKRAPSEPCRITLQSGIACHASPTASL